MRRRSYLFATNLVHSKIKDKEAFGKVHSFFYKNHENRPEAECSYISPPGDPFFLEFSNSVLHTHSSIGNDSKCAFSNDSGVFSDSYT